MDIDFGFGVTDESLALQSLLLLIEALSYVLEVVEQLCSLFSSMAFVSVDFVNVNSGLVLLNIAVFNIENNYPIFPRRVHRIASG